MNSRSRAWPLLMTTAAITVALTGLAPHAAVAQVSTCTVSVADQANDAEEQRFLELLNDYRAQNGLNRLAFHPDVTRAAAWFSRDMATKNYFPPDHVDSNGRGVGARLTWCGVTYTTAAENIYASTNQFTAQAAFDAWKNSPGHNTNMLATGITSAGVARAFDAASTYDWYWTLDLTNTTFYRHPPADFDNNRSTDISVFRPSTGTWFVRNGATVAWGTSGDTPVPADYDGDGSTDIAVFRPSTGTWFVRNGVTVPWGTSGDIPVPGDYDADGRADIAVFRPSTGTWFVRNGATVPWGTSGDIPVPGDYDGNGTTDIAVFRPSAGTWFVRNGVTVPWGTSGDIPVPGDYDSNGTTDIAVFRPSTGTWFVRNGITVAWGVSTDIPLPLPAATRQAASP